MAENGVYDEVENPDGEVLAAGYLYEVRNIPDLTKGGNTMLELIALVKLQLGLLRTDAQGTPMLEGKEEQPDSDLSRPLDVEIMRDTLKVAGLTLRSSPSSGRAATGPRAPSSSGRRSSPPARPPPAPRPPGPPSAPAYVPPPHGQEMPLRPALIFSTQPAVSMPSKVIASGA